MSDDAITLPLKVFIVDDEAPARSRLKDLLADCEAQLALQLVGEASNGQEALDKLSETHAEVVLMDIRMPKMDGIELARHLNKLEHPPIIIFTTAYDSYAIQAFEQRAIDYLLKPIRLGRLFESLSRARDAVPIRTEVLQELMPEPRTHLSVHERGKVILVPIEEVLYLRAEMKYITVRTVAREYLIEESLTALEREFSIRFVRIHRSCLVAKSAISGFEKGGDEGESDWQVKLKGIAETLPVSRRQWAGVKHLGA
ncbi:MAG: response regulator transcription factor [Sideroxydans sp.]|nr:response regulator transcription factor [Sideroxydans sp.]NOT97487.1 response regulator transcription factor [Sideroxydans sp.]